MITTIADASDLTVKWVVSSYSGGNNNCVQVGTLTHDTTAVRDSNVPSGPALLFGEQAWSGFLDSVRRSTR